MADKTTFHDHLILNRWLLSLFHKKDLATLKAQMGGDEYEGEANDGQSGFFHQLTGVLFFGEGSALSENDLRRYDLNVLRHWRQITQKRNKIYHQELKLKYFQYLSLIFTEIYLDWYFNCRDALLEALNEQLEQYQNETGKAAEKFAPYQAEDLNMTAFWNATGSGKTLLMHINILQYLEYADKKPDKIIVLTPREGLSRQHVADLALSGFGAALFDKNSTSHQPSLDFDANSLGIKVEVIDINKLGDKSGEKTVAVKAFAGSNLVLVDEGHSGSSATDGDGAWLKRREALTKGGFSFEYSATLGQAVAGKKNALREKYAKSILFDYSYKYFYADGYGKESLILNLKKGAYFAEHEKLYFTACLLSFYQQMYLYQKHTGRLKTWNIEKPLMIFIGKSVADKTSDKKETKDQKTEKSDVFHVLSFLAFFLNEREKVEGYLADLVADKARLLDDKDNNIFLRRFAPLMDFAGNSAALYDDILRLVFNAESSGRLQLKQLKKAEGELSLSVGDFPAFGVINIGNAADFAKSGENYRDEFDTSSDEFSGSLFDTINTPSGNINFLIGSKKFTEGWSSWRVSTMGLLNMGKSEGSQIIQLFGRGVRLKGQGYSLKRSLPGERPHGVYLEKLETLNIFGINADYMEKFREYLAEEGVDTEDIITLDFKVQPNLPQGVKLRTLALDDEYKGNRQKSFKRSMNVDLFDIPKQWQGKIRPPFAVLDCYPRIQALASKGNQIAQSKDRQKQTAALNSNLFELFDWDRIYLKLQQHKLLQSWNNLRLDKGRLKTFAETTGWYKLYIPSSELAVQSFADVKKQEGLLIELLLDYADAFYKSLKAAYEGQFYREKIVDEKNGSMLDSYLFSINKTEDGRSYEAKLNDLKRRVESGELAEMVGWTAPNVEAICFDPHLFYPIMVLENKEALPFTMKPLSMNEESEIQFVKDLQKAAGEKGRLKEWTGDKDLYLLRNAANKAKGLGFALAGNFYPDFLLWLVDRESGRQWLTFIDPKGIRHMTWEHPKFGLADEVKKLGHSLKLQNLTLNSFILSVTPYKGLLDDGAAAVFDKTEDEFREKHILFMEDENYLQTMFDMILNGDKA
ncbi:TPA: DEAD/DEAH box helicase family protein [Neisseria cinerea]